MATKTKTDDVIKSAVEAYEAALRTGAEIQEQAAVRLKEAMANCGSGSVEDWQAAIPGVAKEAMEKSTANMEEAVALMNKNAVTSMELLQQALEVPQSGSVEEAQAKTKALWEAGLSAMRQNTEAVIKANKTAVDAWTEAAKQAEPAAAK